MFANIRNMRIPAGETVAIQGLGGLGHPAPKYASEMGYRVVARSSSDKKEQFAQEGGANEYVGGSKEDHAEALQKLGGAALIVATAPDMGAIKGLIGGKLLVLDGKFCASTSFLQPPPLPVLSLLHPFPW